MALSMLGLIIIPDSDNSYYGIPCFVVMCLALCCYTNTVYPSYPYFFLLIEVIYCHRG